MVVTVEPIKKTNLLNWVSKYLFGGGYWFRLSVMRIMIVRMLLF
jgi:hypothetical protein